MRALAVCIALAATPLGLAAQAPAGPTSVSSAPAAATFEIDFTNPGLTPAHWVLRFTPDGNGHFRSERGTAPPDPAQGPEPPNVDRDVQVSPDFAARAFDLARQHNHFSSDCDSHMKVAFQGWKKLTYTGPDGAGSCTFNYSKDKAMQNLGESLVAVASTIVEGARLETLLQHDRLGLDREMEYLTDASADGRVQQMVAIKPILEKLADDPEVMERVRKRARALLARASVVAGA